MVDHVSALRKALLNHKKARIPEARLISAIPLPLPSFREGVLHTTSSRKRSGYETLPRCWSGLIANTPYIRWPSPSCLFGQRNVRPAFGPCTAAHGRGPSGDSPLSGGNGAYRSPRLHIFHGCSASLPTNSHEEEPVSSRTTSSGGSGPPRTTRERKPAVFPSVIKNSYLPSTTS